MANVSVTHTFTNGTATDATQVNTNFTDIINGTSDGTKDFSIAALTCSGTATLNGNVNIGNSSADDLTITGSLASTIPVKTTGTYNFGSATLGLLSVYFGNATNSNTARILGGVTGTSYTLTVPTTAPASGKSIYGVSSSAVEFLNPDTDILINCGISTSVSGNALTVALKQSDGSTDATSAAPVFVGFRSATATSGSYNIRSVTGSLSLAVSSGSTLGTASGRETYIYVYLLDDSGTVRLGVSLSGVYDNQIVTTVAEGGAGGADSNRSIYSGAIYSNVPARLVGRLTSSQATAGTWATAISHVMLAPIPQQIVRSSYSSNAGQVINTGVQEIVDYEDVQVDPFNCVTTGAAWVWTAPFAGTVQYDASIQWSSSFAANVIAEFYVQKNSVAIDRDSHEFETTATLTKSQRLSGFIDVAAGDTINFLVEQGGAGDENFRTAGVYAYLILTPTN